MIQKFGKLLVLFLLAVCPVRKVLSANRDASLQSLSLAQLEQQITDIDTQLGQLAKETLRTGVGNLGWLSRKRNRPQNTEWVEINLGKDMPIDLIVLAPIIWLDENTGPRADAFPEVFRVIVGRSGESEGTVVASFSAEDHLLPRVAPVHIPITPRTAAWVRVEATMLSKWAWEDKYLFQLSEVMVFNGQENVALHQPVRVSSAMKDWVQRAMNKEALVDGFVPYLMDAAQGGKSDPYIAFSRDKTGLSFTVDLEETQSLNGLRLHAADLRENVPKIYHADYAFPKHLLVEGANQPDFTDAVTLTEYHRDTIYEMSPIVMLRFPETPCRYVRLTALETYKAPEATGNWHNFGLAEIELLSHGHNMALGKLAQTVANAYNPQGEPAALTDGLNHYGNVLSIRDWMEQLARRQELETVRPLVAAELNLRYGRQQRRLHTMSWLAAIFGVGIVITVLVDRILRLREVARLKQRFAADLHDELGANLHSIGLISDAAQDAESVDEWMTLSQRIRELTERTGTAVRHCTNMIEAPKLYIGLVADMRRAAQRIATNLEHGIVIEGEPYLNLLEPRTRVDLFLFYKECLINICRHSGATRVSTHLSADNKQIVLTVSDNGTGLPESARNRIPPSLQRRANLLKARLTVVRPPDGGTSVRLKLRHRWWTRSVLSRTGKRQPKVDK